ncbi:helix-turn-helix transcriptional regulator [Qipengyuania sp. GH25]|uniref:Helix-turn-helix transcriptional regulator n=1 Tax=Qipengyuania pacifica TaxID=2860199 RepID=A0ABS7JBV4_9SPHN|nr:helix-turn-helix transcriptional regulator [Qipengyuania aerophila]MBX7487501.1 helix-turn-helix transcriptional regulator [Qipengyuania aerophila]
MPETLENHVRRFREERGWTQAQLAQEMGVSRKTVNTVENGIFSPSVIVALKFAAALGQPVDRLFELVPGAGD